MSDIFSLPIHMLAFLTGKCPKCRTYNEEMVCDYGKVLYRDLEEKMDKQVHQIKRIICKKCSSECFPSHLVYRVANGVEILRVELRMGGEISEEENNAIQKGHEDRKAVFKSQEVDFWAAFTSFALEEWRESVNELLRSEIEQAYKQLGITVTLTTDQQARRDVLNRLKTDQDKSDFWRLANHYFIYDELLDIGAMGWTMDVYAKRYGSRRTRFTLMHFPIAEAHERYRTQWIGQLFRRDKGDNAFLLRRISQLSDDVTRANKRVTEIFHQNETYKHEVAGLQTKLAAAYEASRKEEKATINRDPDDIRKIRELKSFVSELMAELRELRPAEESLPPVELTEEAQRPEEHPVDTSVLSGKTVGIIGGIKRIVDREYPCNILISDGTGPDFYSVLDQSDYIVVLTRYVSHAAMWEAKAHALQEDKPALYLSETNVERILFALVQAGR